MTRRPPAFQFYADDFLAGVCDFTAEEVGVYIQLLCVQWSRGYIADDPSRWERITGACREVVAGVLKAKFIQIDRGWVNARLEEVREKQQTAKQNGSKGGSKTQANRVANDAAESKPPSPSPSPSPRRIDIDVDQIDSSEVAATAAAVCRKLPDVEDKRSRKSNQRLARDAAILVAAGVYSENWLADSVEAVLQGKRKPKPWGYFLTALRNKAKEMGRDFDCDRKLVPP